MRMAAKKSFDCHKVKAKHKTYLETHVELDNSIHAAAAVCACAHTLTHIGTHTHTLIWHGCYTFL